MDRILLNSRLFRLFISKIIKRTINKSLGVDSIFSLQAFDLQHKDNRTKMFVSFCIEASDEDIIKIMKKMDAEG